MNLMRWLPLWALTRKGSENNKEFIMKTRAKVIIAICLVGMLLFGLCRMFSTTAAASATVTAIGVGEILSLIGLGGSAVGFGIAQTKQMAEWGMANASPEKVKRSVELLRVYLDNGNDKNDYSSVGSAYGTWLQYYTVENWSHYNSGRDITYTMWNADLTKKDTVKGKVPVMGQLRAENYDKYSDLSDAAAILIMYWELELRNAESDLATKIVTKGYNPGTKPARMRAAKEAIANLCQLRNDWVYSGRSIASLFKESHNVWYKTQKGSMNTFWVNASGYHGGSGFKHNTLYTGKGWRSYSVYSKPIDIYRGIYGTY